MKRRVWFGLITFLILNVLIFVLFYQRRAGLVSSAYAKENQELGRWIAGRATTSITGPISMIGALALSSYYSKILPLAKDQKDAIIELNRLVKESRTRSMLADAEPFSGSPESYRNFIDRNEDRRRGSIRHAQRLALLGLLTEEQEAIVTSKYLRSMHIRALNRDVIGIAERIGFTEGQRRELDEVRAEFENGVNSKMRNAMSPDPNAAKEYYKWSNDWSASYDKALAEILTPSQRDKWAQLEAKGREPAVEPPDLRPSPASVKEAERIDREGLSPVFRFLDKNINDLDLSSEQQKDLQGLEQVTRQGLLFISLRSTRSAPSPGFGPLRDADQVAQSQTEFLKHAEQVALLGILSAPQSEKVQAAITQK